MMNSSEVVAKALHESLSEATSTFLSRIRSCPERYGYPIRLMFRENAIADYRQVLLQLEIFSTSILSDVRSDLRGMMIRLLTESDSHLNQVLEGSVPLKMEYVMISPFVCPEYPMAILARTDEPYAQYYAVFAHELDLPVYRHVNYERYHEMVDWIEQSCFRANAGQELPLPWKHTLQDWIRSLELGARGWFVFNPGSCSVGYPPFALQSILLDAVV